MKIEWYTDPTIFDELEPEWNTLLARSVSDTLFLTNEWQRTWWRHLGTGNLRVITLREDDGTLLGIAPLFAETGSDGAKSLSLVGCVDVSDYLDLIVARGAEARVYAALLDTLTHADFPAWDWLSLCTLPAASPANTQLKALAEVRGLTVQHGLHDVSPMIELPETWDAYLETLDKKQRHEVRRKLRRIEEAQARWYTIDAADALDQAVTDFVELHKRSRPDKNLFMDARMRGFFGEMARVLFARGWLQLSFLEISGARAAAIMNFVYHNDILVYNSGYDPVQYGAYSPGIVLFARSIQDALTAKRRQYDFLRGNEEYKYRFGARDIQVMELQIGRQ
ncbi:MAG: GNAT family N-acetyltransferase [Anaerolineales bacterium]|nr:GNAT family N-acetyltransferase [Anaerolineales bacterium]